MQSLPSTPDSPFPLLDLPTEMIYHIVGFTSPRDRAKFASCSQTCKDLVQKISKSDFFQPTLEGNADSLKYRIICLGPNRTRVEKLSILIAPHASNHFTPIFTALPHIPTVHFYDAGGLPVNYPSFEPLSSLTSLKQLSFLGPRLSGESLKTLSKVSLKTLKILSLSHCPKVSGEDIEELLNTAEMPNISHLKLSDFSSLSAKNLAPLEKFSDLGSLSLYRASKLAGFIKNTPLRNLPLTSLDVSFIKLTEEDIDSLAPLKNKLKALDLTYSGTFSLRSFEILSQFTILTELRLRGVQGITNASMRKIVDLASLESLVLDRASRIDDESLHLIGQHLTNLTYVNLGYSPHITRMGLLSLKHLDKLILDSSSTRPL